MIRTVIRTKIYIKSLVNLTGWKWEDGTWNFIKFNIIIFLPQEELLYLEGSELGQWSFTEGRYGARILGMNLVKEVMGT